MISSSEPSANNKSLASASWIFQLPLTPLTIPFFWIDSLPGSASMAPPCPGSIPTSQTVPSSHPVVTPNPLAVRSPVVSHKAQSLAHFCSLFTQPHSAPSSPLPASATISTLTTHNSSFPSFPQSTLPQLTSSSRLSLKSLLGCLQISFL